MSETGSAALDRLVQASHFCDRLGKWSVIPDQCLIVAALQGQPVPLPTKTRNITHGSTLIPDQAPDNRGSLVAIFLGDWSGT